MRYRETTAVYCKNHTQHINTTCEQNSGSIHVKSFGICINNLIWDRLWAKMFLCLKTVETALGPTQPPIQWVPGVFLGVKRQEREGDHLYPSSAEIKNE
jgi:hypothetical protein